jgi:fatty-acid peroxygenase
VREEFDWRGRRFAEGTWALLDLYGTNHDARIWGDPETFRPERFRQWDGSAFDFIPQRAATTTEITVARASGSRSSS